MNYSIEKIFHFVCINCQLWWSIATENMKMDKKSMTCPHCKHVHLPPNRMITMNWRKLMRQFEKIMNHRFHIGWVFLVLGLGIAVCVYALAQLV